MGRDGITQAARIINPGQRGEHLRRDLLVHLHIVFKLALNRAREHIQLFIMDIEFMVHHHMSPQIPLLLMKLIDLCTLLPLHQHLDGTVRQLQQLQNGGNGTGTEQLFCVGIILRGILLGHQQNLLLISHRRLQRSNGAVTSDKERNHHMWIDHHISQGQYRKLLFHYIHSLRLSEL